MVFSIYFGAMGLDMKQMVSPGQTLGSSVESTSSQTLISTIRTDAKERNCVHITDESVEEFRCFNKDTYELWKMLRAGDNDLENPVLVSLTSAICNLVEKCKPIFPALADALEFAKSDTYVKEVLNGKTNMFHKQGGTNMLFVWSKHE